MTFRLYNPETDRAAAYRIWCEVGWIRDGIEDTWDTGLSICRSYVALINNEPEVFINIAPGTVRHLTDDLQLAAVAGVTVSHIARKQGLAKRLLAYTLAESVAEGALVSGLGMFDQGFYNMLGFGTGSYEHWIQLDPAQLRVNVRARTPRRITADDWRIAHAARIERRPCHGLCKLPAEFTRAEMVLTKKPFGLGYFDGPGGTLSHYVWGEGRDKENGPYRICWMVYQTNEQFLELMALLKSLGDQVCMIEMREPAGIQMQDLLEEPFRTSRVTRKSNYETRNDAVAFWQMRILDLPKCLAQTHLRCDDMRFNLQLTDPIERYLGEDSPWRGITGSYIVTLGTCSGAESGSDTSLPTLTADVGAFTRLWLGVRPATGLNATDTLAGPPELLEALDWAFRLPQPHPDWDF